MASKQQNSKELFGIFKAEHQSALENTRQLENLLTNLRYEGKPALGRNLKEIRAVLNFFNQDLMSHISVEEGVLFPFVGTHVPKLEPALHLLQAEHEDFKGSLRSFDLSLSELEKENSDPDRGRIIEKVRERGTYLIYLIRNHIQAEMESVYRVIDQELRAGEKKELEKRVKKMLGQNPSEGQSNSCCDIHHS